MKKKLMILSVIAAMFMTGCKDGEVTNNDNNNQNNTNENTNNGENNNNGNENGNGNGNENGGNGNENGGNGNGNGGTVKPPVIITNSFEAALKKDYSNMSTAFALSSKEVGDEYGYEYYAGKNDFVAVLDGTAAETFGTDYAWDFYCNYEGNNYSYWKQTNSYVTSGWVAFGKGGHKVGIDMAYFYMPYFLNSITADDVSNVMGVYVVKSESMDKVLEGLKFTWLTNDISYVDISVNGDGYISRIRGFDDPNDDSYGFVVELSAFGTTRVPTSVELPPEIGPTTVKTYVEMIGHEEIPDIYMTKMDIVINDTVNSNDDYDIIMYPDDVVDLSFTYQPSNANKREVHWISTNEDAAICTYGQVSGHQLVKAINPGETEVYLLHYNDYNEPITSKKVKVKVVEPKQVEQSAADVYRFTFTGHSGTSGNNTIGAVNTVAGSNAPFTIKAWRMYTRDGSNSEHFADDHTILYSDAASSNYFNSRFEDEVIFDFENQQVNKVSFLYGLYWDNNPEVVLGNFESATLSTSNDGVDWKDIDITEEFRTEFAKTTGSYGMTPKVMTKEFLPASMVKLVIKAKNVGGNGLGIGMENFAFSKDENCHNYDDVDAVPVTSITVSAPRNKVKIGNSMKLDYVVLPANASNSKVRWVSDDPETLKVDSRTGLVTGVKAGVAHVTAVSTSNASMVSNSYEVTVYEQEEIYDPDNLLLGNNFVAEDVMSGTNMFDVSFNVTNKTSAVLTLAFEAAGLPFETKVNASYEEFDALTNVYTYLTDNDAVITFTINPDNTSISLTYVKGSSYILGNESGGVTLRKAA